MITGCLLRMEARGLTSVHTLLGSVEAASPGEEVWILPQGLLVLSMRILWSAQHEFSQVCGLSLPPSAAIRRGASRSPACTGTARSRANVVGGDTANAEGSVLVSCRTAGDFMPGLGWPAHLCLNPALTWCPLLCAKDDVMEPMACREYSRSKVRQFSCNVPAKCKGRKEEMLKEPKAAGAWKFELPSPCTNRASSEIRSSCRYLDMPDTVAPSG